MQLRSILFVVAIGLPSAAFAEDAKPTASKATTSSVTDLQDSATGTIQSGATTAKTGDDAEPTKPWSLSARTAFSVGSASFASNDYIADYYESIGMSMTLGAGYSFDLLGKSLRAGFSFPFRVALQDEVNSNPSRRFSPFDSSLSLSAGSLFNDEDITGINVSGRFSWALPTSYESINIRKKWGGLSTGLTFSRAWGGFNVSVSSSYFKSFHSSKVPLAPTEIYRASDLATVDGDVAFIERGFANTSYGFSQGLSLGYSFLDNFSVGYNVGIANYFKYDIVPEDDVYTPEGSDLDTGAGRLDALSAGFSFTCNVAGLLEDVVELPTSLSATLAASASHPAQTPDNKGFILPVVFNNFGNRAANNYSSISLSLTAAY